MEEYYDSPVLINNHIKYLKIECKKFPELVRFQFHKFNL